MKFPQFGKNNFIAPNATIVGNVEAGDDCSFWFNTVVRGDVNFIKLGNKVNVQDGACIHCTYQRFGTTIGNNVSIGHNAIVHGCTVHDNVLVGMGAIIMDNAVVNSNTNHSSRSSGTGKHDMRSRKHLCRCPGEKGKRHFAGTDKREINRIANNYIKYADWFRKPAATGSQEVWGGGGGGGGRREQMTEITT